MIDYAMLEALVLRAIQRIEQESQMQRERIYLMLPSCWSEDIIPALTHLSIPKEYEAFTVVPPALNNDYFVKKLKGTGACGTLIEQKSAQETAGETYLTLFPIASKTLIAKAALCIADTFETAWIERCIEQGQRILLLKSGLPAAGLRAPKAYLNRLNEYYRILSDYGIEILNDIPAAKEARELPVQEVPEAGRRIITHKEIADYVSKGRIVLRSGDRITMLAKEKARELGIEVVEN